MCCIWLFQHIYLHAESKCHQGLKENTIKGMIHGSYKICSTDNATQSIEILKHAFNNNGYSNTLLDKKHRKYGACYPCIVSSEGFICNRLQWLCCSSYTRNSSSGRYPLSAPVHRYLASKVIFIINWIFF